MDHVMCTVLYVADWKSPFGDLGPTSARCSPCSRNAVAVRKEEEDEEEEEEDEEEEEEEEREPHPPRAQQNRTTADNRLMATITALYTGCWMLDATRDKTERHH